MLDKWFAWGEGQGEGGRRKLCHFIIFSKKAPLCDCFGTEYKEIIKVFVCLGHLPRFLMPYRTGKIARLEFTMGFSINICAIICTHTITIESSPIK